MDILLEKLLASFGVPGHETEVRDIIIDKLEQLKVPYKTDIMGNLIVTIGENKDKKFMVTSHMDTIGVIITFIDNKGCAKIGKLGEFNPSQMVNTIVEFENGNCGRVSTNKDKVESIDDLYVDFGVDTREEALELVSEGDVGVFSSNIIEEEKNIMAPFLNDRVSCYILLKVIENLSKSLEDINSLSRQYYFVFSTQSNLRGRGVRAAAFDISPEYALVIDGEKAREEFPMSKGCAMKFMDGSLIMHHEMKTIAEEGFEKAGKGIKYIYGECIGDGGSIHREGVGVKTGTIIYPVKYRNTNLEMVAFCDIEDAINIVESIVC